MTGDEEYIPSDMLKSQASMEAWLSLTGHRHLHGLGSKAKSLRRTHDELHLMQSLFEDDVWESLHQEVLDEIHDVRQKAEAGKAAIWN